MNRSEAKWILLRSLATYRKYPYAQLRSMVGETKTVERVGGSGAKYQLEFDFLWDASPGGDIRVMASIDDGGWWGIIPLTCDLLVSPSDGLA